MTPPVRVRFAPAPTGYLHIGGARTALFNWLFARQQGGELVLRIEDTDAERSRPELIDVIFRSLEWLGIDWDGDVVRQSERSRLYLDAVDRLLASGHAYWCDCTPDQVKARAEARGGRPGYDGHCRDRGLAPPERRGAGDRPERPGAGGSPGMVVRFRVPDEGTTSFEDVIRGLVAVENDQIEDFVLLRSSGEPMFLVANAVDDADLGITHVVRGEDLINVTPKVLLLRRALGFGEDPVFAHLPLIVNEKRQKLSKRRDDVSVGDYIDRGYLAEAMANYLATLGWGPPDGVEIRPISEIVELFRLESVTSSSAFFDLRKLDHFNGAYIRALPVQEFVERSRSWLEAGAPWAPEAFDEKAFERMAPLVQERVTKLDEVPGYVDFLFLSDPEVDEASWTKAMAKDPELTARLLDAAAELLASCDWTAEAIAESFNEYADTQELKRKVVQAPVRVAVTGRSVGPPLWESIEVLGRDESLRRVGAARARL